MAVPTTKVFPAGEEPSTAGLFRTSSKMIQIMLEGKKKGRCQALKGQPCHQSELLGLGLRPKRAEQSTCPRPVFMVELGERSGLSLYLLPIYPWPVFLGELEKQGWPFVCLIRPAPLLRGHMTPPCSVARRVPGLCPGLHPLRHPLLESSLRLLVMRHKLIPPFNEDRDDLDAYLQRFERVATSQEWPRSKWPLSLNLCLTGEALTVIGRLDSNAALDYDQLKATLLQRFRCTAEGYREKFRTARPEDHETGLQYAGRISGYIDRWVEMTHTERTYDSLRDAMIAEQFLGRCSASLRVFLKEGNFKTLATLSKNADCFKEAHNLTNLGGEKFSDEFALDCARKTATAAPRTPNQCFLCDKAGHRASECWSRTKENPDGHGWSGRKEQGEPSRSKNQGQASCMLAPCQTQNRQKSVADTSCFKMAKESQ
ncbi:hypothetical protein HPB49_026263 [Dermacentor silvarum]|nr:hypothetical protein HPB49_026263 [Dermacentor silvarum]